MISLITKFLLNIFVLLVFCDFYIEAAKAERFENVKAYELFKKEKLPSNQKLNSIGSYSNGCLAGGIKLPESGNTWQAMRLSRNRNLSLIHI